MKPTCRLVRSLIPSRDPGTFAPRLEGHIGACLTCQAEIARYGRLRRQLASLADEVVAAPEPLAAAIDAAISPEAPSDVETRGVTHPARLVAAAGAVVAASAGAVAVAVWRHSRPAVR